jgi:hypothetical protein
MAEAQIKKQERAEVKRRPGESKLDWIQRIVPAWYFEIIREKLNVEQVDQHFGVIGSKKFKPGMNNSELKSIFPGQEVSTYEGYNDPYNDDIGDCDDLQ